MVSAQAELPQDYRFSSIIDMYEFPAADATGVISAQLPLFEISNRGVSLPVSLIYNMHGNSNAFSIGHQFGDAWNLNIQGTIQRTTKPGLVEISQTLVGYQCGQAAFHSQAATLHIQNPAIPDEKFWYGPENQSVTHRNRSDEYTFSVNGLEGKFTLYKQGNHLKAEIYESSDYADIQIHQNAPGENISRIIITDKNGLKYYFEEPSNMNFNYWYISVIPTSNLVIPDECNGILSENHTASPFFERVLVQNPGTPTTYAAGSVYSRQVFTGDYHFWRNLELTKIVDKNNNTLLTYEYETAPIKSIDSESSWVDGLGHSGNTERKYLKKINIPGQGSIDFTNVIGAWQSMSLVNSYTSKIEMKDLIGNPVKKMEFNYISRELFSLYFNSRNNYSDGWIDFRKRLLTEVKTVDTDSAESHSTTIEYKDPPLSLSHQNTVADRFGNLALTRHGSGMTFFSKNDYIGDSYLLQKIKYPTGGSVLYKFEPHTFSHGPLNAFANENYDDVSFEPLTLTPVDNTTFRFSALPGDHIYILNLAHTNPLVLYKGTQTIYENVLIQPVRTQSNGLSIQENDCKCLLSNMSLPASDNQLYTLKYSYSNSTTHAKVYRKNVASNGSHFRYTEGSRIAKTAYFQQNVSKNILQTAGGEEGAEKVITYTYPGDQPHSSSGHIASGNSGSAESNYIAYDKVKVAMKEIGSQVLEFDLPDHYSVLKRTDLKKASTYSLSGALLSESEHSYTYHQPEISGFVNPAYIKPFIRTHLVENKYFEGSAYTSDSSFTTFDTQHRQVSYTKEEVLSGTTYVKEMLPSYALINNTWVNTYTDTYLNGIFDRINKNTFDANGNFLKSEFKKPDTGMYDFELYGKEITRITDGRVEEYRLPNGTYVSQIWGYNKSHIVAELYGVRYGDISIASINTLGLYSDVLINSLDGNPIIPAENNLTSTFNNLRVQHPEAKVTSYMYRRMIGMRKRTDPNGIEESYEYDGFNRLRLVRDHNGDIVKRYTYNIAD